ncbi:hypothetical protein C922_02857 [Plasmodium inui San Antonio 1]|uniref:Condensin-2 complex subunit H2 C-terminal domain-containing protein n=1 Tax=Plasmodium inui San Antonio 1 TaxID=1237626 RepID=W7A0Z1_9APIC|nr:hypothetical protein C922_02857 [Plasmodium inui San Antonio 1]EUD66872.1 hypothetical protein C922_02857 [Plasmodium inui San Antonio 1]
MSTPDELTVLIQNLQKCNNTSESINFDLARTIQEFLNCLDRNVLEELEGGIHEGEREKESDKEGEKDRDRDVTNSFTSAAIFVENCVKIFGLKIEHLHNLAHNTLYNIYKDNKHSNAGKKHIVMSDEEEYLFINEVKNLKSCPGENESCLEDDLLIKTIPLPTFLFSENVKKKEGSVEMRADMATATVTGTDMDVDSGLGTDLSVSHLNADGGGGDDRKGNSSMSKQNEGAISEAIAATAASTNEKNDRLTDETEEVLEQNSIKPLNFDKMYLENDGILLLDINDYNVFINDQYDFSILNQNSSMLFEKYDFSCSRHSTYLSPANLSKYIEREKMVNDIYKAYNFNDLLNDELCSDVFLFKSDFFHYDLALGIIKSKKYLLNRFKEQKKYLYVLDENAHMDKDRMGTPTFEKNEIKRKLPHYYMLNCQNIKHAEDFFTYMQPSQIIDIITRNAERQYFSCPPSGETSQRRQCDSTSGANSPSGAVAPPVDPSSTLRDTLPPRSNDQKLFEQIKIPDIYIQKLGLNFDYYHLEPLIYNLIKELKKKKNVEKYFSLDLFDEKNNYDLDILQDEDYVDDQNEENTIAEGHCNLTSENFLDVRSLNDGMLDGMIDDIPLDVFEKKDSSDAFFASFDDDIHDRVNKWNVFLEEKLQLLRSHPKYDVDVYKKNIIHYTVNSGEKIPLCNLIQHREPYQVCRNFLTTLMLINTDMLQISQVNRHSQSNDVSNYQINVKKENVQEYLASSKKFKNTSFVLKDKKRKTASKGGTRNAKSAKKKPHKN